MSFREGLLRLYPYDFENLYRAYRKARKGGKRKKEEVAAFELDLEALGRIR